MYYFKNASESLTLSFRQGQHHWHWDGFKVLYNNRAMQRSRTRSEPSQNREMSQAPQVQLDALLMQGRLHHPNCEPLRTRIPSAGWRQQSHLGSDNPLVCSCDYGSWGPCNVVYMTDHTWQAITMGIQFSGYWSPNRKSPGYCNDFFFHRKKGGNNIFFENTPAAAGQPQVFCDDFSFHRKAEE
ncbi:hypothetical protein BDW62DRAFT_189878 [Aspergillus aurantiobrunneus]